MKNLKKKLIELWKKTCLLYDVSTKAFSDRVKKAAALEIISQEMNVAGWYIANTCVLSITLTLIVSNCMLRVELLYTLFNCVSCIALDNCFRKIFDACWRESAKPLLFYCGTMPVSLLVDQRKK